MPSAEVAAAAATDAAVTNGEADAAAAGLDADGQPLSKSALKKLKAKEEKAKKKAEHKKEEGKGAGDDTEESSPDVSEGMYGKYPLNQSQEKKDRQLVGIQNLTTSLASQRIW